MLDKLPDGMPPWVLEAAIAVITSVFAAMIGNVGSTIVMVPLAINLGIASGGDPTAFALVAALSGSNNIVTLSNPVIAMIAGRLATPRKIAACRTAAGAGLHRADGARDQSDVLAERAPVAA